MNSDSATIQAGKRKTPIARGSEYQPDVTASHIPPGSSMSEMDADPLSPNNPLQSADFSLTRLVSGLYRRIADAEAK